MNVRISTVLALIAAMGLPACSDESVPITADKHKPKPNDDDPSDSDDESSQGSESGSRLKTQAYQGSDGSKQFAGWYDSGRGEECAFALASNGVVRCLPNTKTKTTTSAKARFFDSGCLFPLFESVCEDTKYLLITSSDDCKGVSTSVFPLIEQKLTEGAKIYWGSPEHCYEDSYPGYAGQRIFGAQVPPSEFVSAEIVTE